MARMRMDVARIGSPWNDTLVWYARAVQELKRRKLDDRTSWRYLAAIHGIAPRLWRAHGYLGPGDLPPSDWDVTVVWNQCQHQSWFFLPWHRGYLAAFESIVRDAIVKLGGPADWALPYWNYFDPASNSLPPAFLDKTMPDGSDNPLYVPARYGDGDGSGNVTIRSGDISYKALKERDFIGTNAGIDTGFGGPETAFHGGGDGSNGHLESDPHNTVHSLVGGVRPGGNWRVPEDNGLMAYPETAALDPIFWLHHANIDRMWEIWLARDPGHEDPPDTAWRNGPVDRRFVVPTPTGTTLEFSPLEVLDTRSPMLDYTYQDVSDPLQGAKREALRGQRLQNFGLSSTRLLSIRKEIMTTELLGANAAPVPLGGGIVQTTVDLDKRTESKVSKNLSVAFAARGDVAEPDRVFLNLENVRGQNDAAVFYVYVNVPPGEQPQDHPEHQVGVLSLFGVSRASGSEHGGNGITQVLEITDVVDALHLDSQAELDKLTVQFVPRTPVVPEQEISVERVSVFRQGS